MKKLFYSFLILFSVMFLYKTSSFADVHYTLETRVYDNTNYTSYQVYVGGFNGTGSNRYALLLSDEIRNGQTVYNADFYSNSSNTVSWAITSYWYNADGTPKDVTTNWTWNYSTWTQTSSGVYICGRGFQSTNAPFVTNFPTFDNINDLNNYILYGVTPEDAFDDSIELDSFDVWSYGVRDSLNEYSIPEYTNVYEVTWSNPDITTVKVRIDSTLLTQDFVSQSSPYTNYFRAGDYANVNGDVITLTATPYTSDGHYGISLYYSFVYDGNNLVTNLLRKFMKTNHYDNTIEIPFNGVDKTYDVDGITTNKVYKVYYNPETNEYNDYYLYDITYAPIIVYPYETPSQEITDTQDVVNNNYVTNNYYETTENINVSFDFNFDDVSAQEVQDTYDDIGGFFDGFGVVVGRLVDLLTALFPFLSPAVATFILAGFALIVTLGIIALVLKIASIIADFIPL